MKTTEEIAADIWDADISCPDELMPIIGETQLDAFKAGAKWAAGICDKTNKNMHKRAILIATDQLTEIPK